MADTRTNSRAQIVATIGPASKSPEVLERMIRAGLDVARLNFSWGTHAEHAELISTIRAAARKVGKEVPIIQDLSGPRVQHTTGHSFNTEAVEALTLKDIKDLKFGIEQEVEYVALSYVGSAGDLAKLRSAMQECGGSAKVVAKIERKEALANLDAIIESADAVMVARGDLGQAVNLAEIPWLELEIIRRAKKADKPVITATQMMLSMTEHPEPTRAEVTDVYFAIMQGSDAVMLSEESASGKYPVEAVQEMDKIVLEAEKRFNPIINPL